MASEKVQNFAMKMLSEKVFSCAICKNLLMVPIMIVENIGNVCQSCFEVDVKKEECKSLPDTTLNTVLKELKFPCKFLSGGCKDEIFYNNLKQHESQCIYRPVDCLMPREECQWNGKLADLLNHFKEDHSKHVLNGPYEEFSFEMNVEKVSSIIKLFRHRNRTCVLRIEKPEGDNSLLHFLQDTTSTAENLKMVVKYVGRNNVLKRKLEVLRFDVPCDERFGKKMKLSTLTEVSEQDDTIKIVIKPEKCEFKNVNSEMVKHLECPVCKEVMRPPILQCCTGHSICQSCRNKVTECPTCKRLYQATIRNFSLEALTPFMQYPCVYSQFGCNATFLGSEIDEHEGKCKYQMYECPKGTCKFAGIYTECKQHFKQNHKDDLVTGTVYEGIVTKIAYSSVFTPLGNRMNTTKEIVYFFEYDNIFELSFSRLADSCSWCMRILSNYDKSVQYYFTVRVIDARITQRFIAKSGLCLDRNSTMTDNDIISFKYDSLMSYKNSANDQMHFSCDIFEKRA